MWKTGRSIGWVLSKQVKSKDFDIWPSPNIVQALDNGIWCCKQDAGGGGEGQPRAPFRLKLVSLSIMVHSHLAS
jgi:hypothetical protein